MKKSNSLSNPVSFLLAVIFILGGSVVSVRADAVGDWNEIAVQTVLNAGSSRPGPSGNVDVAVLHAAIYDAVQAIEKDYQPYYVDIPGATGSTVGATAKAAHDVLANRFPSQAAALGVIYTNYLIANGVPPGDPGIAVGAAAAAGILALRSCDGAFPLAPPPFIGGLGVGVWRPTPPANSPMNPGPWLGKVTPFFLTRPFQFRSPPPPELTSRRYARDYNEVKRLGAATGSERTAQQTDVAQFYAGNFVVMMNRLVRDIAAAHVDNISDSSRLFALTSMAQVDTMIGVWDDKSFYVYWRPITAIHNGHLDGNDRTEQDGSWNSLIASPPYPDYSSGANGFSGSTARALRNFFGRDRMEFSLTTTNTGPTVMDTRDYERFSEMADDVEDARVYLGIHFRFADEAARTLGGKVADFGYQNYLRPINDNGDDDDDLASSHDIKR